MVPMQWVQFPLVATLAALYARDGLVCVVAFHRAKAAAGRLEQRHRAKIPGWAEVQVELERK
jgi:hypothetical protein